MKKGLSGIAAVIAILCWTSSAFGQEKTERYIPIGQSPGISGMYAYLGEIQSIDAEDRTITVQGAQGSRTIRVTDETWIYLDRTKQRMTNLVGEWTDLQPGRTVEIKYVDYETKDASYWIKVEGAGGG